MHPSCFHLSCVSLSCVESLHCSGCFGLVLELGTLIQGLWMRPLLRQPYSVVFSYLVLVLDRIIRFSGCGL